MAPVPRELCVSLGWGSFLQRVRLRGEGRSPSRLLDLVDGRSAKAPLSQLANRGERLEGREAESRLALAIKGSFLFLDIGCISCSRHDASNVRSAVRSLFGLRLLWTACVKRSAWYQRVGRFDVMELCPRPRTS